MKDQEIQSLKAQIQCLEHALQNKQNTNSMAFKSGAQPNLYKVNSDIYVSQKYKGISQMLTGLTQMFTSILPKIEPVTSKPTIHE